eukprot:SAG22_NODE_1245_length_5020_cov_1.424304_3_plen_91_part_00
MFGMHEKLLESNKVWSTRGIPEIVARIGVHTGEALSGNIGSPVKMKFGATSVCLRQCLSLPSVCLSVCLSCLSCLSRTNLGHQLPLYFAS